MTRIASYNDIIKRLRNNAKGYFRELRPFLATALIAGLADMSSTIYFMLKDTVHAERHPAIRIVSWAFGPIVGPVLGKMCQFAAIALVTIYLRRWAKHILVAVTLLYALAAWYNIWGKMAF